jgi:D-beta-D-heptose 7-phosphate kinase / D-beta-D-heptose 1-phosphate adenosyltransferase
MNQSKQLFLKVEDLSSLKEATARDGKKIILTSGYFDMLHEGHLDLLCDAKAFGDVLIVAIPTDESIREVKGQNYPINSLLERAKMLKALSCVDQVVQFSGDFPSQIIKKLQPDVYVKGSSFTINQNREAEEQLIEKYGGQMRILPFRVKHFIQNAQAMRQNMWQISPFVSSYSSL